MKGVEKWTPGVQKSTPGYEISTLFIYRVSNYPDLSDHF